MLLNTAVARKVSAEMTRQGLKPAALAIGLNVGDRKASALRQGKDVWTTAQIEAAAEMLGVALDLLLTRCASRLASQ